MAQQIINTGAAANDGTGDPLRTAFTETNSNFTEIYTAGPVGSNVRIANNTILTLNTNGNLVLAPNGTGRVVANVDVVPSRANVRNLGSSTARWSTVYTQYLNVTNGTTVAGDLTVGGNLTVTGDIVQVGNIITDAKTIQLANTASTANAAAGSGITVGANDDIATLLYNSTGNVWTTNIGLSATGNITAPYFIGNGSQLTGIVSSYGNSNVTTLLASLGSNTINGTGNITTTANISGGFILGNVAFATGIPATYGNANVAANLAAFGSNPISTTGNISGGFILGNISQATGFPATYGNANVANYLPTFSGNISAGNVSATGNISGAYIKGNGSELTNLPAPTVTPDISSTGDMSIMTYDGVIKSVNYATVEPSSGNIKGGNIFTFGNVTAGNVNSPTLNNSGNISVVAGGNTWTFGTDGRLINQEGLTLTAGGQFNICTILTGGSGYDTGSALKATTGGSGTGMTVGIGYGLSNQLTNADVVDPGTGYVDGDVITVSGGTGGTFVITRYNDQANQGNNNFIESNWTFGDAGNLSLPRGGVVYETNIPSGGLQGNTIALKPAGGIDADQQLLIYPTVIPGTDDNHLHLTTGNLWNTELFLGNDTLYVKLANTGNIVVNSNDDTGNIAQWTFGANGNLTLPGGSRIIDNPTGVQISGAGQTAVNRFYTKVSNTLYQTVDAGVTYRLIDQGIWSLDVVGEDNPRYTSTNLITWADAGGGLPAPTGTIINGSANITVSGNTWTFNSNGNLILPSGGNVIVSGAIVGSGASPAPSLSGFSSVSAITISASGNISSGNVLTTGIVSATGNVSGNYFIGNGSQLTGIAASYGNANVANFLAAFGSNTISTTGNITAGNFVGNISITGNVVGTQPNVTLVAGSYSTVFDNTGNLTLPGNTFSVNYANNTPVNAVTRVESSWTVPVGNSTQSFTVPINNTYQLWVLGNIPNGIIVYNATVSVSNTNVPVIGQQFAWVYNGGGTPIDFTSIPNQFIGTADTIVRSNTAPSATTNRFDFGINNTSGGNVTVRYGWIAIS